MTATTPARHPAVDRGLPCPQVVLVTDGIIPDPPTCTGCGWGIDGEHDYYLLYAGRLDHHPEILGAAHAPLLPDDADETGRADRACADRLEEIWHDHLHSIGADTLHLQVEPGGQRWYLGDHALHAGTPVELLDADGRWIRGRYEYLLDHGRAVPRFHWTLGGWNHPETAITIPTRAALRLAGGS